MNVTSYAVSKKLAEIGFKSETEFYYLETSPGEWGISYSKTNCYNNFIIKSYDLETLLAALPKVIYGMPLKINLDRSDRIGYSTMKFEEEQYVTFKRGGESLADTAARLLILLESKGLVNFNKDNNKE